MWTCVIEGPTKHRNTPKIYRNTLEYAGIHQNTRTCIPNNQMNVIMSYMTLDMATFGMEYASVNYNLTRCLGT